MFLLPASMKRIGSKTAEKHGDIVFTIISVWGFFLTLKGSEIRSLWSDLAEFRTHPSSYVCHRYLQEWKGSDKKQPRKRGDAVFPIITLWELSVGMETRVLIRPGSKPNAGFPHPNDASDKIWLQSAPWS